jgi:hypothetical protein
MLYIFCLTILEAQILICAAKSVPYPQKNFMTVRSSRISAISLQSLQEETIQNSLTRLKFRIDKFMFLNSEPKHVRIFG